MGLYFTLNIDDFSFNVLFFDFFKDFGDFVKSGLVVKVLGSVDELAFCGLPKDREAFS